MDMGFVVSWLFLGKKNKLFWVDFGFGGFGVATL